MLTTCPTQNLEKRKVMSLEENKELVRRFLEEIMNERNISVPSEFMVPESMFAGAFGSFVTKYIKEGFPDFHLTIESIFGEGDKVLVQTTAAATQTGLVMGHPASGKTYLSIVIYIFKIANEKIIHRQWVMDRMEMAQQLGWIPIPGPP
jgi:predicted ester cyclase